MFNNKYIRSLKVARIGNKENAETVNAEITAPGITREKLCEQLLVQLSSARTRGGQKGAGLCATEHQPPQTAANANA